MFRAFFPCILCHAKNTKSFKSFYACGNLDIESVEYLCGLLIMSELRGDVVMVTKNNIAIIKTIIRQTKKRVFNKRAVSPVIATVIIFALIMVGVGIVFLQAIPYINRIQAESAIASAESTMLRVDTAIKELLEEANPKEAIGSSNRIVDVYMPAGRYEFENPILLFSLHLKEANGPLGGQPLISNYQIGDFHFKYRSPFNVLPKGGFEYLTGTNPFLARFPAVVQSPSNQLSENLDMTNMVLYNNPKDPNHYIRLFYRPKIVIQITTKPTPTLQFLIYIVNIQAGKSNLQLTEVNERIKISASISNTTLQTFPADNARTQLSLKFQLHYFADKDFITDNFQLDDQDSLTLWNSNSIDGLSQALPFLQLQIVTVYYTVTITQ